MKDNLVIKSYMHDCFLSMIGDEVFVGHIQLCVKSNEPNCVLYLLSFVYRMYYHVQVYSIVSEDDEI